MMAIGFVFKSSKRKLIFTSVTLLKVLSHE